MGTSQQDQERVLGNHVLEDVWTVSSSEDVQSPENAAPDAGEPDETRPNEAIAVEAESGSDADDGWPVPVDAFQVLPSDYRLLPDIGRHA